MSEPKDIGEPEHRRRVTVAKSTRNPSGRTEASRSAGEPGTTRKLRDIAATIKADWGPRVHFGAVPYLDAMSQLDNITDQYGSDSAEMVVRSFLNNAKSWQGVIARRVKEELKALLGEA